MRRQFRPLRELRNGRSTDAGDGQNRTGISATKSQSCNLHRSRVLPGRRTKNGRRKTSQGLRARVDPSRGPAFRTFPLASLVLGRGLKPIETEGEGTSGRWASRSITCPRPTPSATIWVAAGASARFQPDAATVTTTQQPGRTRTLRLVRSASLAKVGRFNPPSRVFRDDNSSRGCRTTAIAKQGKASCS